MSDTDVTPHAATALDSDVPTMKLGLLISGRQTGSEAVAAARAAEEEGLASCWIIEDLWHRGAVPLATACLAATHRIEVGIGVVNPYTRHPTLLAQDYAAMAELFEGRIVMGIGPSAKAWIQQMGLEYRLPRTASVESIEIVRELLAGEESHYQGRAFRLDRVQLSFTVAHPTPLYLGAMGERTVRSCGSVADGWILSILMPLGYVKAAREWLHAGAAEAGRTLHGFEVVQYFPFSCASDSRSAKNAVKPLLGAFLAAEVRLYEDQTPVMRAFLEFMKTVDASTYLNVITQLADGADPVSTIPDELVDELTIAGTPEECATKLSEYASAGVTHAALLPTVGDVESTVRMIGQRVAPLLDAKVGISQT